MMKIVPLVALLLLPMTGAAQWVMNPSNKHLYRLNTNKLTWKMAEAYAVSLGGHLATVRNKAEQDWLFSKFGGPASKWLGLTDQRVEGQWEWISGESSTYTNWCAYHPKTGSGGVNKDYAVLRSTSCWEDEINHSTWLRQSIIEFAPTSKFSVFGKGCASTTSLPTVASTSTPKVGKIFTFNVSGFLPKSQFGQLIVGRSNTNWGFIKLPWDLTILGMGGCNLLVSLDFPGAIVTNPQGSATVSLKIPVDATLYGATFYGQAWVPDPKANSLGVATTNAFETKIGF